MDTAEACERRAWRLAALLTGDTRRAERIVAQALDAQPDPTLLPDARLDRLIILRTREEQGAGGRTAGRAAPPSPRALLERLRATHRRSRGEAAPTSGPAAVSAGDRRLFHGAAAGAHDAILTLPAQGRAAWILRELDGKDMIEIARAMDCSKSAAARHLEQAHDRMIFLLGDQSADAVRALRQQADGLDPGEFIVRRSLGKRRGRRNRLALWAVIFIVAVVAGLLIWSRLA